MGGGADLSLTYPTLGTVGAIPLVWSAAFGAGADGGIRVGGGGALCGGLQVGVYLATVA